MRIASQASRSRRAIIDGVMSGRSDPTSTTIDAPSAKKLAIVSRMRSPSEPSGCGITSHIARHQCANVVAGVGRLDEDDARRPGQS